MKVLTMLAALMVFAGTVHAEGEARDWTLVFHDYFVNRKAENAPVPLTIYAREGGGKWISGVGSSRDAARGSVAPSRVFNGSWQYPDMSKIPIVDGHMKGTMVLHLTPDMWVPVDHKSYPVVFTVDAKVTAEGGLEGSYTTEPFETDAPTVAALVGHSGKLTADPPKPAKVAPIPGDYTLALDLQGSRIGAKETYPVRCTVLSLGVRDGAVVSASRSFLTQNLSTFAARELPLETAMVKMEGNRFSGKVEFDDKTLDLEPCRYAITFEGLLHNNLAVGTYRASIDVEGRDSVVIDGSYDGQMSAGASEETIVDTFDLAWFVPVVGHTPIEPGEHPRMLFRKRDLPALRQRAETPTGKAILKRLRYLLDGKNGDTFAPVLSPATSAYSLGKWQNLIVTDPGVYTFSHAAGYGLLYQLTGEQQYADLGKKAFEAAFDGVRDRDDRYSFRNPDGALRIGPALGWFALGYDLCYDGWDEAFREKVCRALAEYNEETPAGKTYDLEDLTRATMPPGSNHYGMQVGGAAMVLMAITGDKWVDQDRIDFYIELVKDSMIRNISEGFGDHGQYAEGDGTGSMATYISYLTAVDAMKNVLGIDFVNSEYPNLSMTTLKWLYQTRVDQPALTAGVVSKMQKGEALRWTRTGIVMDPIRGAYPQNVWARDGLSGGGYFAIGFSGLREEQKQAWLWFYNHNLKDCDETIGAPYDTVSPYPHVSVCSFVNWPFELEERNPAEVLPLCYIDSTGFMAWRNRWRDMDDTLISVAVAMTKGYHRKSADKAVYVTARNGARALEWGKIGSSEVSHWWKTGKGELSVFTLGDGSSFAVDFSGKSGVDVMLVTTSQAKGKSKPIKLGGKNVSFLFPTVDEGPQTVLNGDVIAIGEQRIGLDGDNLVFKE